MDSMEPNPSEIHQREQRERVQAFLTTCGSELDDSVKEYLLAQCLDVQVASIENWKVSHNTRNVSASLTTHIKNMKTYVTQTAIGCSITPAANQFLERHGELDERAVQAFKISDERVQNQVMLRGDLQGRNISAILTDRIQWAKCHKCYKCYLPYDQADIHWAWCSTCHRSQEKFHCHDWSDANATTAHAHADANENIDAPLTKVTMYNHDAAGEGEVSVQAGEKVLVDRNCHNPDWARIIRCSDRASGWVPQYVVAEDPAYTDDREPAHGTFCF